MNELSLQVNDLEMRQYRTMKERSKQRLYDK